MTKSMRIRQFARRQVAAVALAMAVGTAVMAAQSQDREALIELVRSGKSEAAWAQWSRLPDSPAKLRLGVELSAESGQIAQGLGFYDQLTSSGAAPDTPALSALAVAVAVELSASGDARVRTSACGAALLIEPAHSRCLTVLAEMADQSSEFEPRLLALIALANAGDASAFGRIRQLDLRPPVRVRVAQALVRASTADRVALVTPVLGETDVALQYEAILVLASIPGPDALTALRALQVSGPLRMARTVALARQGDSTGLGELGPMLPNMDGYLRIQAARAMVDAGDLRGAQILNEVAGGPVDLDRVYAAEALVRSNPGLATRVIRDSLVSGSGAVRPAAVHVAGRARMGLDPAVYRGLVGSAPDVRAATVAAIAETVAGPSRGRIGERP